MCVCILKSVGPRRDLYFLNSFILYLHTCNICVFPACCFRQRTYAAQGLVNGITRVSPSLIDYPIIKALCCIYTLTKATSWKHI